MDAPMLSQQAARARTAPEPEVKAIEAVTAFVVLVTPEGQIVASPDIKTPLNVSRPPTEEEIEMACSKIAHQFSLMQSAQMTAQLVVNTMLQAGQQMASQQMNQKVLDDIKNRPNHPF